MLFGAWAAALCTGIFASLTGRPFWGWLALGSWLMTIVDLLPPPVIVLAVGNGLFAVFFTWKWWDDWGDKRRRVRALLGAKSRALRDRLVEKLGERRVPVPA